MLEKTVPQLRKKVMIFSPVLFCLRSPLVRPHAVLPGRSRVAGDVVGGFGGHTGYGARLGNEKSQAVISSPERVVCTVQIDRSIRIFGCRIYAGSYFSLWRRTAAGLGPVSTGLWKVNSGFNRFRKSSAASDHLLPGSGSSKQAVSAEE